MYFASHSSVLSSTSNFPIAPCALVRPVGEHPTSHRFLLSLLLLLLLPVLPLLLLLLFVESWRFPKPALKFLGSPRGRRKLPP